jgi:hypothetical protein
MKNRVMEVQVSVEEHLKTIKVYKVGFALEVFDAL